MSDVNTITFFVPYKRAGTHFSMQSRQASNASLQAKKASAAFRSNPFFEFVAFVAF